MINPGSGRKSGSANQASTRIVLIWMLWPVDDARRRIPARLRHKRLRRRLQTRFSIAARFDGARRRTKRRDGERGSGVTLEVRGGMQASHESRKASTNVHRRKVSGQTLQRWMEQAGPVYYPLLLPEAVSSMTEWQVGSGARAHGRRTCCACGIACLSAKRLYMMPHVKIPCAVKRIFQRCSHRNRERADMADGR
jgi:hypothetical protein